MPAVEDDPWSEDGWKLIARADTLKGRVIVATGIGIVICAIGIIGGLLLALRSGPLDTHPFLALGLLTALFSTLLLAIVVLCSCAAEAAVRTLRTSAAAEA